jgi:hypothetical protein
LGASPVVRQKFGEPRDGVSRDARQNILESGKRIDSSLLTRGHETAQHRGRFATLIAAEKYPVVAADGHATDRAFRSVVVDLQISSG